MIHLNMIRWSDMVLPDRKMIYILQKVLYLFSCCKKFSQLLTYRLFFLKLTFDKNLHASRQQIFSMSHKFYEVHASVFTISSKIKFKRRNVNLYQTLVWNFRWFVLFTFSKLFYAPRLILCLCCQYLFE